MGREIRMVPKNWQHPTDERTGHFKPLYDLEYGPAAEEYLDRVIAWDAGTHPDCAKHKETHPFWWDWDGNPPDSDSYRPAFTEPATCFQIYETVSEGTPVSPIFETKEQMLAWLLEQGHTETSARDFVEGGWCPSMVTRGGKIYGPGIGSLDGLREENQAP